MIRGTAVEESVVFVLIKMLFMTYGVDDEEQTPEDFAQRIIQVQG